jgi:ATP-dependent DNA helicase RecG
MPDPLARKLAEVIGDTSAKALERAFGHRTLGDLVGHLPRRYAHRGELTPLAGLHEGEEVTVVATVARVSERRMAQRKGSIVEAVITDGVGSISLTWFNQGWRLQELHEGARGLFAGKVGEYRNSLQLTHPEYELFGDEDPLDGAAWAERPIPMYPATGSLPSWRIGKAIGVVLDVLPEELDDPVPAEIAAARGLVAYRAALEGIHRPEHVADWQSAREALRYQEALVLQTALVQRRDQLRAAAAIPRVAGGLLAGFDAALGFELTGDQRAAGEAIAIDLAAKRPMNRLIQGEVGSGKTLVAIRAMLAVAEPGGLTGTQPGGQSALLAPTEVLAQQHIRSITAALGPDLAAKLRPTLITGRMPAAERKRALLAAASGQALIVVGTHALFGEHVSFADLGLVVIDEQHRFGVEQRDSLRAKAAGDTVPHQLVLTATPIPRTVAMTVFGDLDVTTIAELPAGRAPIESHVVPLSEHPGWISRVWDRLSEELGQGRQGFVVVPAIDESEQATVEATLAMLQEHPAFSGRAVRPLHGRMATEEKDATMRAFAAGEVDVLVATTVIEVGVDVPNASAMVVLDADRFGVSQLHQLRGRVGRGGLPGLALFVTSAEEGSLARERVDAVAATIDGFALAERDLALRHEGDVLGAAQSGRRSGLRLLSAAIDGDLIASARDDAIAIIATDPDLAAHPALAAAIIRRVDEDAADFLTRA